MKKFKYYWEDFPVGAVREFGGKTLSKEDIDLKVTSDGIEIRAKADRSREEKEKDYYFRERTYQAYERTLSFPEEVKADLASANLKDGVLEVRVPKKQPTPESKPVKVPVE